MVRYIGIGLSVEVCCFPNSKLCKLKRGLQFVYNRISIKNIKKMIEATMYLNLIVYCYKF